MPTELLERLRDAWNERYPNHKISRAIKQKEKLWSTIRKHLRDEYKCSTEYCAVQELGTTNDKSATRTYFRPAKPDVWKKDPTDWHDSITIAQVMEQYEDAFSDFEFIGPVPIDFDKKLNIGSCVVDELCNLDLATVKSQGKRAIGIVFNLDPHDRPGSHWVCAFIDLVAGAAYYYDSYGYEPCPEIRRLLRRCREQGIANIYWNDIRAQRKKSECGTYCMYIILSLLAGQSFIELCKNPQEDDVMNALRDILYATERPRDLAVKSALKLLRI